MAPSPGPSPHGTVAGFSSSHFSGRAWSENVGDGYLRTPDAIPPAALAGAAILVRPWDRDGVEGLEGRRGVRPGIGNAAAGTLVAGSLLLGLLAPGEGRTALDEVWNQGEAFGVALGAATLLKFSVPRSRPGDSGNSFPSGHATASFTAATLVWRNSGPWLGVPAFALAAAAGFSRVEAGRHYPSDVLAGAALGVLSAGVVDALHFGGGGPGKGICGSGALPYVVPLQGGVEVGIAFDF